MMAALKMDYLKAREFVMLCRRIGPNVGFVKQLEAFEKAGTEGIRWISRDKLHEKLLAMEGSDTLLAEDAAYIADYIKREGGGDMEYDLNLIVSATGEKKTVKVCGKMMGEELLEKIL